MDRVWHQIRHQNFHFDARFNLLRDRCDDVVIVVAQSSWQNIQAFFIQGFFCVCCEK